MTGLVATTAAPPSTPVTFAASIVLSSVVTVPAAAPNGPVTRTCTYTEQEPFVGPTAGGILKPEYLNELAVVPVVLRVPPQDVPFTALIGNTTDMPAGKLSIADKFVTVFVELFKTFMRSATNSP